MKRKSAWAPSSTTETLLRELREECEQVVNLIQHRGIGRVELKRKQVDAP